MPKRKTLYFIILILAVIMLAIMFRFLFIMEKPLLDHVKFKETVCDQEIDLYYDDTDDIYYLFLPAYVDVEDIKIEHSNLIKIDFSDEETDYEKNLDAAPIDNELTMTLTNFYQREDYTFQIMQCDNLPTVFLETESGSLDYVNENKNNEEDASVLIINADGDVEFSEMSSITGRGNSSWGHPKNPYDLKFSNTISVWDFENVSTLCLLANYFDYSCLRDAVVHYAAKENDIAYSSAYQFINLYANGSYMGLYAVATKQEYKNNIETDGILAAFEVTPHGENEKSFQSENGTDIEVIYGDFSLTEKIVNNFENALFNYDFETAYQYVDLESFARKFVLEEFFVNYDMTYTNSQYYYIDTSETIHCMCAWDYDRSLGFSNGTYYNNSADREMMVYNRNNNSWYKYLVQNAFFCNEAISVINDDYDTFFVKNIDSFMEACISEIENSWQCNNVRWEHEYEMRTLGFENLEEFYEFYRQIIVHRGGFLTDYLSDKENYCVVEFINSSPEIYANICIPRGEGLSKFLQDSSLLEINKIGEKIFLGWYTENGVSINDIDIVTEDIMFLGSWLEEESSEPIKDSTVEEEILVDSDYQNDTDDTQNFFVLALKKIYHGLGLESFGKERLALCGVFGLILFVLIIREVVQCIRRKREQ